MVPDGVHAAAVAVLMSHRLHSSWQCCQARRLPSCLQGVTPLCCATRTAWWDWRGAKEHPRGCAAAEATQTTRDVRLA